MSLVKWVDALSKAEDLLAEADKIIEERPAVADSKRKLAREYLHYAEILGKGIK